MFKARMDGQEVSSLKASFVRTTAKLLDFVPLERRANQITLDFLHLLNLESEFGNFGMGARPDEPISIVSIGRAIGRTP